MAASRFSADEALAASRAILDALHESLRAMQCCIDRSNAELRDSRQVLARANALLPEPPPRLESRVARLFGTPLASACRST